MLSSPSNQQIIYQEKAVQPQLVRAENHYIEQQLQEQINRQFYENSNLAKQFNNLVDQFKENKYQKEDYQRLLRINSEVRRDIEQDKILVQNDGYTTAEFKDMQGQLKRNVVFLQNNLKDKLETIENLKKEYYSTENQRLSNNYQ